MCRQISECLDEVLIREGKKNVFCQVNFKHEKPLSLFMQEASTKMKGPTQEEYDSLLAGKLAAGYAVCCCGH